MGFGNIKKSVEQAMFEAVQSREFKNSISKIVSTSINEAAEVIENIVDKKIDNNTSAVAQVEKDAVKDRAWTKIDAKGVSEAEDEK